jgi:hypothetical protein
MWQSSIDQLIAVGFSQFYAVIIYWLINCRWLQPVLCSNHLLADQLPLASANGKKGRIFNGL